MPISDLFPIIRSILVDNVRDLNAMTETHLDNWSSRPLDLEISVDEKSVTCS